MSNITYIQRCCLICDPQTYTHDHSYLGNDAVAKPRHWSDTRFNYTAFILVSRCIYNTCKVFQAYDVVLRLGVGMEHRRQSGSVCIRLDVFMVVSYQNVVLWSEIFHSSQLDTNSQEENTASIFNVKATFRLMSHYRRSQQQNVTT